VFELKFNTFNYSIGIYEKFVTSSEESKSTSSSFINL
jgi:hypothetical protein